MPAGHCTQPRAAVVRQLLNTQAIDNLQVLIFTALMAHAPAHTPPQQRRSPSRTWLIHLNDVRIGVIGRRAGVPSSAPQWGWSRGFYPGVDPGWTGIAETFDDARAAFQGAWVELAVTLTEANYKTWRRQRDWTAWKDRIARSSAPATHAARRRRCALLLRRCVSIQALEAHVRTAHSLTQTEAATR